MQVLPDPAIFNDILFLTLLTHDRIECRRIVTNPPLTLPSDIAP